MWRRTHQWSLTQQFAPSNQVTNGNVEIGMSTTPVRDFGEWVCAQYVLQTDEQIIQRFLNKDLIKVFD